jgi:hypothetical protein
MWRAWGITLLLLSPQDLGVRMLAPEHEIAIRPPSGWTRHIGMGASVVKFRLPGESEHAPELLISHLTSSNPTPLETFRKQARENIKEKFPNSKIVEEKDLSIAGKQAYRVIFASNDMMFLKTVVHRSNLEYYLLDAAYPPAAADKVRPVVEASIATLEIVPAALSSDERAAESRTLALLKSARIDQTVLGERWYVIQVSGRKVGHMRLKLSESQGMYAYESEVLSDFGEGTSDTTSSHGVFSPDGKVQKIEAEEAKVTPKQKWLFKASATLQAGLVKITRDVNGTKEERAFPVEEGVLLNDVVECFRPMIVGAGKGTYLLKTLSPYSDEWGSESVEVSGLENLELGGKSLDCILVQTCLGVRRKTTYIYLPDRTLLRVGGPKDVFSVRAASKEEALSK